MRIEHNVRADFQRPGVRPVIRVAEGDAGTRFIVMDLYNGGQPYSVGTGVTGVVKYAKTDGHSGVYDTLDEGEATERAAVVFHDNSRQAVVELATNICKGFGLVAVIIQFVKGAEILTTFPVDVIVERDPTDGTRAEDYFSFKAISALYAALDTVTNTERTDEREIAADWEKNTLSTSTGDVSSSTSANYSHTNTYLHGSDTLRIVIPDEYQARVFRYSSAEVSGFTGYEDWANGVVEKTDGAYYRLAIKMTAGGVPGVNPAIAITSLNYTRQRIPIGYSWKTTSTGADWIKDEPIMVDLEDVRGLVHKSKNLLDKSESVAGRLSSPTTISENTSYLTTGYIPVTGGKTYVMSAATRWFCYYDAEKTPTTPLYSKSSATAGLTFAPSVDGFMRLSYVADSLRPQFEIGTEPTAYEPFGQTSFGSDILLNASQTADLRDNSYKIDPLNGRKWAVFGDSFTNGVTGSKLAGGLYEGKQVCYPYIIGNRTGLDVLKFFASGKTLAWPAEPGTFTNSATNPSAEGYYQNVPEDVDYITIYLGINDDENHHGHVGSGSVDADGEDTTGYIPLGTIDDTTTATHYGAWNAMLSWLIANRPKAHIGIIVTNGSTTTFREAQLAIASKYGIPYIDLNGDGSTPAMIRSCNPDIASDVKAMLRQKWQVSDSNSHPNDAAHEYESRCIEAFIRRL